MKRKTIVPIGGVDAVAAEFERFWRSQENLGQLELRRIGSGQTLITFAILEMIQDHECEHDPPCEPIEHQRATITLARRWRDRKETEISVLEIHQPSGYQTWLSQHFGLPVSQEAIESIPEQYEAYLQSEGIIPVNHKDEQEAKPRGSPPEGSGDLFQQITITGGVVGAIGGQGHHIEQGIESPEATGASPDVDFDRPPLAAVRELLTAAFTPETLYRFCLDRPLFQPIVAEFGTGHGLDDMIDRVMDHCRTQLLWREFLDQVAKANPRQYTHFERSLQSLDTE